MLNNYKKYAVQFKQTLLTYKEAALFIRKHKLWEGFWKYGWVSRVLIGLAIILGLKFVNIFVNWIRHLNRGESRNVLAEMGTLIGNVAFESYNFLFVGGLKYIMILLLEVVIFHICRRTLEILTRKTTDLTFKTFLKAQVRMFKLVLACYIFEMIFTVGIKIAFGIFGFFDFLQPIFIFAVQCYFLGFLVMDNYIEQFGFEIKESMKYGTQFIGVSLAIGLFLSIVLLIPLIGAIIGPMIAAVTLTLVMYRLSDLHLEVVEE